MDIQVNDLVRTKDGLIDEGQVVDIDRRRGTAKVRVGRSGFDTVALPYLELTHEGKRERLEAVEGALKDLARQLEIGSPVHEYATDADRAAQAQGDSQLDILVANLISSLIEASDKVGRARDRVVELKAQLRAEQAEDESA